MGHFFVLHGAEFLLVSFWPGFQEKMCMANIQDGHHFP